MTLRCKICRLDPTKLGAIDSALRNGASLQAVADENNVTKSAVWRHGRHLAGYNAAAPPPKAPDTPKIPARTAPKVKTPVPVPVELAEPAPEPPVDVASKRQRALDRAEQLWDEVSECLQLAREPVVIVKPDGTELEVPVDLRTRSAVVRAGRDVIDLDAKLNGLYDPQAAPHFGDVVFQNVILMPKTVGLQPSRTEPKVVDVQPEPAALTDGGTPGSGDS